MSIVELKNVYKIYPLGKTQVRAVDGVSFSLEPGAFISIAGPSGSGKTTILNMIGCMDVPTEGEVLIQDQSTSVLKDREITDLRHKMLGFIFQSFNLIPVLTAYENIRFPLRLGSGKQKLARETDEYIRYLLEAVELEDWADHRPAELSGGQRQRVAIARALVNRPAIVLADEPTANLDSATGRKILELMKKINQESQTSFIFSTHDQKVVDMADYVLRLEDGKLKENAGS